MKDEALSSPHHSETTNWNTVANCGERSTVPSCPLLPTHLILAWVLGFCARQCTKTQTYSTSFANGRAWWRFNLFLPDVLPLTRLRTSALNRARIPPLWTGERTGNNKLWKANTQKRKTGKKKEKKKTKGKKQTPKNNHYHRLFVSVWKACLDSELSLPFFYIVRSM